MQQSPRNLLLQAFSAALAAVNGRNATARWLAAHPLAGPVAVVAVGKAAAAMTQGALDALGAQAQAALAISKPGHFGAPGLSRHGVETLTGGHPLPNAASLAAGERLLGFIRQQPPNRRLLFLISGGASSLAEVPRPGIALDDLRRVNQWLLGSGLDIATINGLRRRLSRIKGGGLLEHLRGRDALLLCISDVQGDDPAVIGSGPLSPPARIQTPQGLPDWLQALLLQAKPQAPAGVTVPAAVVAHRRMALEAAARAGQAQGLATYLHKSFVAGPAEAAGRRLAAQLRSGDPGLHIWGGETTVVLPPNPGRGGRNQHLALAAAGEIADHSGLYLLAAGTDGTDGPGEDAGALVDAATIERGRMQGLDPAEALRRADSGAFLEAAADLISTGPTGSNVMDLAFGLKLV